MPTPQRLPIVNSDDGVWGDIIRQYIMKEHFNDDTDNAANGGHQKITIRAGAASAGSAPLKFTTGTLLTTPEAGAMEFAGDNYYLTQTTSTTRKKIAIYDDTSGATGDIYYRNSTGYFTRLAAGSNGTYLTVSSGIPAWTSTIGGVSLDNTSTVTLKDTNFTLQDDGDTTKQVQFQLSGITTGTTRTLTVPNASGTLYVTGGTDVSVADGGTGRSTNTTAYGIIAAGTTATGAMQTISPGSAGQFLKSAGASALASFASLTASDISDSTSVGRSVLTAADAAAARTAIGAGTGSGDVTLTGTETLTNKTLTTPTLTTPVINGTVTGTGVATAATANLLAKWDANKNLFADNFIATFTTTATAAGTTTLTVASTQIQVFTGTSTQTVRLPTTSVVAGTQYRIINNSTGAVTVQSSGANTITILAGGSSGLFTALQAIPTTAAHWDPQYWGSFITSGKALNVTNSLTLSGTDGTTMTFPSSSDTVTTLAASQTLTNKTLTSPRVNSILDTNGNTSLVLGATGSAVNYLQLSNAASGNNPIFYSQGTGTNIGVDFVMKGTGNFTVYDPSFGTLFATNSGTPGSNVNYPFLKPGVSGAPATFGAWGSDTNVGLDLATKGTGTVTVNGAPIALSTDVDGKADVKTITSGKLLTGSNFVGSTVDTHPESGTFVNIPHLFNDLAYNNLRGGSVVWTKNGSGVSFSGADNPFLPDSSFASGFALSSTSNTVVAEVTTHQTFNWGTTWGIVMTPWICARNVTIEVWDNTAGTWNTAYTATNDTSGIHWVGWSAPSGNNMTKVRYTLTNFISSSDVRITQLFAVQYNSPLLSGAFLPRGGGQLYGDLQVPAVRTSLLRDTNNAGILELYGNASAVNYLQIQNRATGVAPGVYAQGADTNIDIDLIPKGSGRLKVNSVNVPTISSVDTLSNKTLSSPVFTGSYSFGGTPTWPTFNQNTTGSAATLTTTRTLQANLASTTAANFNGSANASIGVTGTLPVANGGTGRATATTAYGIIAAGTTATGAQQTISPGTSGQFLKSAGTSALASFAAIQLSDLSDSSSVATLNGVQSLANKTLTTPTIASFTNATHNHTNAAGGGQLNPTTALTTTGTPSASTYLRGDNTWATITTGDASTNTATSVDGEVTLFSGTGGKTLKRATGTGLARLTSGVLSIATAGTDYLTPAGTETLTNKTLTNPTVNNYTEGVVSIGTVTTASTLDLTNGTVLTATLTASTACTFTMPTAVAGKSFILMLKQAASTGNGSATFSGVKWNAGGSPTITTAAGKMDIFNFFSDGANWYGSYTQGYTP